MRAALPLLAASALLTLPAFAEASPFQVATIIQEPAAGGAAEPAADVAAVEPPPVERRPLRTAAAGGGSGNEDGFKHDGPLWELGLRAAIPVS